MLPLPPGLCCHTSTIRVRVLSSVKAKKASVGDLNPGTVSVNGVKNGGSCRRQDPVSSASTSAVRDTLPLPRLIHEVTWSM